MAQREWRSCIEYKISIVGFHLIKNYFPTETGPQFCPSGMSDNL